MKTDTRTTAELREAARIAASNCRWSRAADLMEAAIARYPEHVGELQARDIARMQEKVNAWRASIGQDDDMSDFPTYDEFVNCIKNAA